MKKKILLIILINLILIATFITYIKIKQQNNTNDIINNPELNSIKIISLCKDETNCPILIENIYGELSFDFDDKTIQQWIKKINKESEQYYQETISSNTEDETCINVKDIYNYKLVTRTYYNNYISDNYISLSVLRTKQNLCTNEIEELPTETFLYSLKRQKQITKDELKNDLNLTDEIIKEAIQKNMQELNQVVTNDYDYSKYSLYYDLTGDLLAEYKVNNGYYSVIVINK